MQLQSKQINLAAFWLLRITFKYFLAVPFHCLAAGQLKAALQLSLLQPLNLSHSPFPFPFLLLSVTLSVFGAFVSAAICIHKSRANSLIRAQHWSSDLYSCQLAAQAARKSTKTSQFVNPHSLCSFTPFFRYAKREGNRGRSRYKGWPSWPYKLHALNESMQSYTPLIWFYNLAGYSPVMLTHSTSTYADLFICLLGMPCSFVLWFVHGTQLYGDSGSVLCAAHKLQELYVHSQI